MYLIPNPKHLESLNGTCDTHSGIILSHQWSEFASLVDSFGLPFSESGVPIQVCIENLRIPETLSHRDLIARQAYKLVIDHKTITITVQDKQAIYAGLATLKQIIEQHPEGSLPCLSVFDYPVIPYRGIMLDVSRGKIPNRKTFRNIVLLSHRYKYNILQLYWEDSYRLSGHERIGLLNGFYDRQEVEWMESLCSTYGIELQANIQTFSHLHGLLRLPEYSHLAENEGLFTLAPGKEAVYSLLDEILGELLPWFSSSTVHLNMDEAYDLGTGYSKAAAESEGQVEVYVKHINRVSSLARKHGAKKFLIWGDALTKYPQMQSMVDEDVVFVDWNYNPEEYFPSLEHYDGREKEFWVAPGTSSWNAIFPRLQNSYINIKNYISQAMEGAPMGVLMTHWGDYGHHQPFSFSNPGFIYGAEQSYNGGATGLKDFEKAAGALVYADGLQLRAVELLSRTNYLPGVQVGFKSQSYYSLFDDFFKGLTILGNEKYPLIPRETHIGFIELGNSAVEVLEESNTRTTGDGICFTNSELLQAARLLVLTGKKGLLSYEIRKRFARKEVREKDILQWILEIKLLFVDFSLLQQSFTQLWEEEALTIGREAALYSFDKAASRFDEAVRYLAGQRLALLHGEKLDGTMENYTAHKNYTTLWTMDCMNMWDRAYPWR